MTREEAEEIYMAVEMGLAERYGITRAQYAEALLIIESDETEAIEAFEMAEEPDSSYTQEYDEFTDADPGL